MNWLLALIDMGMILGVLEPSDEALILSCFNTRGKTKGCLAAQMPNSWRDKDRHAAWCALMSTINAMNVSIGTVICMDREHKAIFARIDDWTRLPYVGAALNQYGQHYCQFNLDKDDEDTVPNPDVWAASLYRTIDGVLAKKAYA